jgi:hypothetical protein
MLTSFRIPLAAKCGGRPNRGPLLMALRFGVAALKLRPASLSGVSDRRPEKLMKGALIRFITLTNSPQNARSERRIWL